MRSTNNNFDGNEIVLAYVVHNLLVVKHLIDFQYVIEKKKPGRICFGSGLVRDTNPLGKGLSSFQKRSTFECFTKITPQTYNYENITSGIARLRNKVGSNRGISSLASSTSRFPYKIHTRIPSPTRYNLEPQPKQFRKTKGAFGCSTPRKTFQFTNWPGAGTYNISFKHCPRTRTDYNFGKPQVVPAIKVLCLPKLLHICERCETDCKNDFWQLNGNRFLCHFCMEEERVLREDYTIDEMNKFEKLRTCGYKHDHAGTTAAVQLLPTTKIRKMEALENYLSLFMK